VTTSQAVYGASEDLVDIFLTLAYANPANNQSARVHDGTTGEDAVPQTAGFRPPPGWVEMGYVPHGSRTQGYRDYNNDGVRDQGGNVYHISTWGDAGYENMLTNRAPRYADQAIDQECCGSPCP